MVKLVDMPDLGSGAARRVGSSPILGKMLILGCVMSLEVGPIQKQRSPSCCDRISLLCTDFLLIVEVVSRRALSILATIVHYISLQIWPSQGAPKNHFSFIKESNNKKLPKVDKSDLEHYTRLGTPLDIQRKLREELERAQAAMQIERDKAFVYREGGLGDIEKTAVGLYQTGTCHYIGRRETMEDEHLTAFFVLTIGDREIPVHLFAVFDGHGGNQTAQFLKEELAGELAKILLEFNPEELTDEGIWNALKLVFVRLNDRFKENSGSTATALMILDGKAWVANVGDSRTILVKNGGITVALSEDAKPSTERFKKGIEKRGGYVLNKQIIQGAWGLAVARAVGDHVFGRSVSTRAKITVIPLSEIGEDSHFVLACDGIFDVASSKQIGAAVHENRKVSAEVLARNIVNSAYSAGSQDNLSIMIIEVPS